MRKLVYWRKNKIIMEREGFLTDAWTAMLFYRACMRFKIKDQKDRMCLLRELVKRKKTKYLRDVTPWLAGKKVLIVKSKPVHNDGPEHWCDECCPGGRPKEKP
jgi:hypothetical protein